MRHKRLATVLPDRLGNFTLYKESPVLLTPLHWSIVVTGEGVRVMGTSWTG